MRGEGGDDFIESTAGSDKLYGGDGHDTLADITRARTYLYGGPGNDLLDADFTNYYGTNTIVGDVASGEGGTDTATLNRPDTFTSTTERVTYVN
jgi:Ca2+-binding RTX toxin-like protein